MVGLRWGHPPSPRRCGGTPCCGIPLLCWCHSCPAQPSACCSSRRKLGDGLFLQCCEEVAELYPKIKFETMIIDNCCMQVRSPVPCPGAALPLLLLSRTLGV